MNQNFKVLFLLKQGQKTSKKTLPIYVRITIDGQRAEWSVQRKCDAIKWDQRAGRAIGSKEDIKALNSYLDAVQATIHSIQKEYMLRNEPLTAEIVRAKV